MVESMRIPKMVESGRVPGKGRISASIQKLVARVPEKCRIRESWQKLS